MFVAFVFLSALCASTPAHILENPCAGMVKSIPSVWDESIVLPPSGIGEIALFAQRKGTTWFLSVINGLKPKTIEIPLSFLGRGSYSTLILGDNPSDPAAAIHSSPPICWKAGFILIDLIF
jgi:alpha-glucosidase